MALGESSMEQALEALQALDAHDALERLEALMELLPVGILLVEGDSVSTARVAACNAACAELFGAGPTPGKHAAELPYGYYRDPKQPLPYAEWPSIRAIVTGRTIHEPALYLRRADGCWRVMSASAAPLRREGKAYGAVVVFQDVTAQHQFENALRRSEERYARLAATVPGVLYEYEACPGAGRFTYLSPRCRDLFEVEARAIVDDGDVLRGMVHPEDGPAFEQALLGEDRAGEPQDGEVRIATPSGRSKWIELRSLPSPAAPGKCDTRSGLMLDVTERKRADEALRETEAWLNLAVEATGAGTLQAVPYGPATISPRFMEMFGISDPAAINDFEALLRFVHPDDRERVRQETERGLRSADDGRLHEIRYRCVRPDGTVRWIAASAKIEFVGTGAERRASKLVVMCMDVTGRQLEEDALRESEERLRALADNIPQVAYMFDPQGWMFWENRRSLEFYGRSVKGLGYLDTIHPDHYERVVAHVERCLDTGETFEDTVPMRGGDGCYRWFLCRVVPLRDAAGAVVRWFGTSTDITELRDAQEALREADRRKTHFLDVLSHELRNPLAPIRNSLYLLRRGGIQPDQAARALDVIDRQSQHLTRLVDDLLDATRISHGKIELQREALDLRDVVRRTCDDHRATFEQRGVRLRFEEPGPLWVEADATRIAQAVGNLLHNAAKFTQRGGNTWVSLGAEGGRAVIRVRDDGGGMEPADVERMFEPFAQADISLARPHGGLGLGLALVKRLAELHGGSAEGRSDGLGRGAEFSISLPLAAAPEPSGARPAAAPGVDCRCVLIIEDNVDAGETLAEVLRVSGHRVHVALDGVTGIAEARRLVPDVVLCDIGLPDLDGYEVGRTLRADPSLHATRLVALTGYAQPEDCARSSAAGFDAHLAKPASLDELERVIARRR